MNDIKKEYCENCCELVSYVTKSEIKEEIVNNNLIVYDEYYDVCDKCHNKFFSSITFDRNMREYGEKIKKQNDLITIDELNKLLEKYNIGKKPLSLVLGLGEITITRYFDGYTPDKIYSDLLKSVLNNPKIMRHYLEKNKSLISDVAYRKVKSKIADIELSENKDTIYLVSKYIIANTKDITPMALQKILYFIQGFAISLYNVDIFNTQCEAWAKGPVYRKIYERFSNYQYNSINEVDFVDYENIDLDLDDNVVDLINCVMNNFGCYSGSILSKMTHCTEPWKIKRIGKDYNDYSNDEISLVDMKNYFDEVIKKYDISSSYDITKYSKDLFKQLLN